jgi:hypothetical protein
VNNTVSFISVFYMQHLKRIASLYRLLTFPRLIRKFSGMWKLRLTEGRPISRITRPSSPSRPVLTKIPGPANSARYFVKSLAVAEIKIPSNTLGLIAGTRKLTPSILA